MQAAGSSGSLSEYMGGCILWVKKINGRICFAFRSLQHI